MCRDPCGVRRVPIEGSEDVTIVVAVVLCMRGTVSKSCCPSGFIVSRVGFILACGGVSEFYPFPPSRG